MLFEIETIYKFTNIYQYKCSWDIFWHNLFDLGMCTLSWGNLPPCWSTNLHNKMETEEEEDTKDAARSYDQWLPTLAAICVQMVENSKIIWTILWDISKAQKAVNSVKILIKKIKEYFLSLNKIML